MSKKLDADKAKNVISFLGYKFSVSIYDSRNQRFVGQAVCKRKVGFMSCM
jgi:hypothetical protein